MWHAVVTKTSHVHNQKRIEWKCDQKTFYFLICQFKILIKVVNCAMVEIAQNYASKMYYVKDDIILSSSHKSNIEDQDKNSKLRTT